jgi:hypothetical protein
MTLGGGILQLLIGWLIADLFSGLLHWLEDRVLWSNIPLLGKYVVVPNRGHHADPVAFTRTSVWERNSTTWLAVVAIAAVWLLLFGFSLVLVGAFAGGLLVTEVHVRAHRKPDSRIWRILQEIGLVQSGRHHGQHHRGAMDRSYCILTGWLNPILDELRIWERIEHALGKAGLEPNRGTR